MLNLHRARIHWIQDPFLDFAKETKNPVLDSETGLGFFPKKCTLSLNMPRPYVHQKFLCEILWIMSTHKRLRNVQWLRCIEPRDELAFRYMGSGLLHESTWGIGSIQNFSKGMVVVVVVEGEGGGKVRWFLKLDLSILEALPLMHFYDTYLMFYRHWCNFYDPNRIFRSSYKTSYQSVLLNVYIILYSTGQMFIIWNSNERQHKY